MYLVYSMPSDSDIVGHIGAKGECVTLRKTAQQD